MPQIWLAALLRALTAPRRAEYPDRLHGPVAGLGLGVGVAAQRGARRGLGVSAVGLAAAATRLAVRAVDLDDLDAVGGKPPGQPRPVGAGALDPDAHDAAPGPQPRGEVRAAGGVCGERGRPQPPPGGVDSRGDMDVSVGVHPADDISLVL